MSSKAIIAGLLIVAAIGVVSAFQVLDIDGFDNGIDAYSCKNSYFGNCYDCCNKRGLLWQFNTKETIDRDPKAGRCECVLPPQTVGFSDDTCIKLPTTGKDCETCCKVFGAQSKVIVNVNGKEECRCSDKKVPVEQGIFSVL